jgi:hypothetical protein
MRSHGVHGHARPSIALLLTATVVEGCGLGLLATPILCARHEQQSVETAPLSHSENGAASGARALLAVFTLVRGGSSLEVFESFVNSRNCLRQVLPSAIKYDEIAFHEGNVPSAVQRSLQLQV